MLLFSNQLTTDGIGQQQLTSNQQVGGSSPPGIAMYFSLLNEFGQAGLRPGSCHPHNQVALSFGFIQKNCDNASRLVLFGESHFYIKSDGSS